MPPQTKNHIWTVLQQTLASNKLLTIGLVMTIIGAITIGVLPPLVLERIVDSLTAQETIRPTLIGSYVGLLALAAFFAASKEVFIAIFGQKVAHTLRSVMCAKLKGLPARYLVEHETGVITSRFVNDVDTVQTLFDAGIISMVADGCKIISILAIIAVKSKGLGLLMILATPLLLSLTLYVQKQMLAAQVEQRVAVGEANNHLPETIKNIRMIHSLHIEEYVAKIYYKYISASCCALNKSNFYDAFYSPVILTISAVLIAVMMVLSALGGDMQSFFGMSVGTAVAIISYVGQVFTPLESIGMEIENVQAARAGILRINEFLEEPERKEITGAQSIASKTVALSLQQVNFGYSEDKKILQDFSLEVKSGENITLVGRTGVGKSTIFKLLLGMYTPWSGKIKIFGVDGAELRDEERAKLIGYVEQSFALISGTIAEQITLKDSSVTALEVEKALELVGLQECIANLPLGLQTNCTEAIFSQGQWQLLSIARAIVHNPPILLLDEITANLDTATEQQVLAALAKATSNRTVLSISHRLYEQSKHKYKSVLL